jgi:hypothetical protein
VSDDPERLLGEQGSGDDPLVRALLGSVQSADPPEGAKDKAWRAIAVRLAAAAAAGAAASSSAAAAKAGVGWLAPGTLAGKAALTVAAGAVAVGGYLAAQQALPSRTPNAAAGRRASAPIAAPSRAPSAQAEETRPPPERAEQHAPARGAEIQPPDRLRAESALLAEARAQLRAGHAARAETTLARLQARFPDGVLVQEREVLTIEVLAARGDVQGARRRASAFVQAHPRSPHNAKLRDFLAPSGVAPVLRRGATSVP